jgi:hypothetical protein
MNFLGKDARRLILVLMLLTSLSLGCSGTRGGPFTVLPKPDLPLAVSDPRSAWEVNEGSYSLSKENFEALRAFIIRQGEVVDIYECQIIAINGGECG